MTSSWPENVAADGPPCVRGRRAAARRTSSRPQIPASRDSIFRAGRNHGRSPIERRGAPAAQIAECGGMRSPDAGAAGKGIGAADIYFRPPSAVSRASLKRGWPPWPTGRVTQRLRVEVSQGDAAQQAVKEGRISQELIDAAMNAERDGGMKRRPTMRFPGEPFVPRHAVLVTYKDGTRGTATRFRRRRRTWRPSSRYTRCVSLRFTVQPSRRNNRWSRR